MNGMENMMRNIFRIILAGCVVACVVVQAEQQRPDVVIINTDDHGYTDLDALAADYYVATNGSDAATGSLAAPWATIQYAVDQASTGDTVHVRGGVYNERVTSHSSGSAGSPLTLKNYADETAVIDGTGFTVGSGWDALVTLNGQDHITVEGLEIRNMITAEKNHNPIGVLVSSDSKGIVLRKLRIHDIETNYTGKNGGDAHGVAVYGDSGSGSISNIVIDGVEIYDCRLGSSESMVLNGNVEDFTVKNCTVHDNNNIGIDFIGHEQTCPVEALDQARNGICIDNLVYNINTTGNPAYGGDRSAGGIYVDGGRDILIERNIVHDCDIGMEIASEWSGKSTSHITMRNNFVYRCYTGGIFVGGYDSNRGKAEYCAIIGNTLFENDTGRNYNGEFHLQMYIENCVFENNLVCALKNSGNDAVFVGGIGGNGSTPSNTVFNHNFYFSSAVSATDHHTWRWGKNEYYSLSAWQGVGHDSNAVYNVDPLLIAPSNGNLHIAASSPAENSGTNRTDCGDTDLDGQTRIHDGTIDIGADEAVPHTTNGTPVAWLDRFGLGAQPYAAADRTDGDLDGMMAWQEYQTGTDPALADSLFKIIDYDPTGALIWLGGTNEANIPFQVWRCTNLIEAAWAVATNFPRTVGINGTNSWCDPWQSTMSNLFYRITAPANL
jgi:hypothetical protein